ncbi:beta-1,3-galactosyltransferase 1 isoform X2 [Patella vulgata]|uniref:beta-1,3-galactosyltransferase 1 isoform X2 n=1 Tax=Patella vulgata TaxID=6465 RepID=UPI00217FB331|nr:beta-1,3-galactosyltransferase 1 isoform X2 [Patella vulgata]XP_050416404.1 beta-1,3-galactosyltransferase 1 isoform X2 [Patella vulgata]XP_055958727.1 beta-1,3-galactosyltransferase 1 isoform X2 [Patella vulgata]
MLTSYTSAQKTICAFLLSVAILLSYLIYTVSVQGHLDVSLGDLKVDAIYQRAVQKDDGSIELVLHIPNSNGVMSSIEKSQNFKIMPERYKSKRESMNDTKKSPAKKTQYPLTVASPYIINSPNLCKNVTNLAFLTIVHTATDHFDRRRIIRETWANKKLFKNISSRIVFVFGLTRDPNIQALLENEQVVHGDIVQGDFLDHYHNLTHKGVLAFRWVSEYCNHSQIIVKIDDDVFLNPFLLLLNIIPKYKNKKRFMLCHVRKKGTSGIMRGKNYKWNVESDQFRGYKNYPVNYCNGYFVLISPDIISAMYRASWLTPFFWVDDVYLYGLLPSKIGHVTHEDIRSHMTLNMNTGKKCYADPKPCSLMVVNAWKPGAAEEMWMNILKKLTKEQKQLVNDDFLFTHN